MPPKTPIEFRKPVYGALSMFEKGFKVFPIPEGKYPPIAGWQDWAKTARYKMVSDFGTAQPLYNWGVLCDGYTVVDLDRKHGKDGFKSLNELIAKHGHLPETFTVESPTGSQHLYFKGVSKNTAGNIADGVDTRSNGGYVVCPGSRINDQLYTIIKDIEVAALPEWLHTLIGEKRAPVSNSVIEGIELNQEHHIKDAVDYLQNRAPECIPGSRNNTLYQVACQVKNLGISDYNLLESLIFEHYPHTLSMAEATNTIRSAFKSSQDPAGSKTPEAVFTAQQPKEAKEEPESLPKRLSDYTGDAPPREWVIRDWLPLNEVSSMYGKGGSGKSLLAFQMAMAVATGTPFMGIDIAKSMPTLCVFCEDSDAEIHRRKNAIMRAPEYQFNREETLGAPLFLWARVGKNNDLARINDTGNDVIIGQFRARLDKAIASMPEGPKLMVLDTLSDIYLGNENVREQVNKFIKTHIGSYVNQGITVLLLAHPSRTGSATGDQLSGSTAWENAVRNRMALTRHPDFDDIMILKRVKSNYAKSGEEIFLQWDNGRFVKQDINQLHEEAMTLEEQEIVQGLSIVLKDYRDMPLHRVAVTLADLPAMSDWANGKSVSTIERKIQKTLVAPRIFNGFYYMFDSQSYEFKKGSRKVVKIPENEIFE